MSYETWEHYSSLYSDVSEDEFTRLELIAERKIDAETHGNVLSFVNSYDSTTATSFQKLVLTQIQTTVCELVNKMHYYDSEEAKQGITSVSNDGYSESYKVQTNAEKTIELHDIISTGLSGTGMCGCL